MACATSAIPNAAEACSAPHVGATRLAHSVEMIASADGDEEHSQHDGDRLVLPERIHDDTPGSVRRLPDHVEALGLEQRPGRRPEPIMVVNDEQGRAHGTMVPPRVIYAHRGEPQSF